MDTIEGGNVSDTADCHKQYLAIENFKYYQGILENYYIPSNRLLKKIRNDLNDFQTELKKDYDLDSRFRHVPILKYHDGLSEIINEFIICGQKLNNDHPYIGKEFDKDSILVVTSLESIKNALTEQAFITHDTTGEVEKGFEKANTALLRLIHLSESILGNIAQLLRAINVELGRDFSTYGS
ncbi:hypothetical protein MmiAt1_04180 [Methanimicrococcus sp. At1]|uniref:Uncharacterized protein n=1 Tax=Methanimicrococcus hacksteinii TaxID=3028293 RepID=A0ABU3VN80_9EURY|nr:hypothetical protein [Methanimicrococcus sp. At1]MDV0444873.1 hypothetical protein [Methanimicrococcus sp. At1]